MSSETVVNLFSFVCVCIFVHAVLHVDCGQLYSVCAAA